MFFGDAKQNYEQRLTVANIKPKITKFINI